MPVNVLNIPVVTAEQMRNIDRLMIEKYRIQLIQMMENAGKCFAEMGKRWLANSVKNKKVVVAAGNGNNGGGGLVAARHLSNWGAQITVLTKDENFQGVPAIQWQILDRLPLKKVVGEAVFEFIDNSEVDLIMDALIGYGLVGRPIGWYARLIQKINGMNMPVLALDVPSGIHATSGRVCKPCIRAEATLTLGLPKTGLVKSRAAEVTGLLFLADIGIPPVLYRDLGLRAGNIFESETIIDLQDLIRSRERAGTPDTSGKNKMEAQLEKYSGRNCFLLG